MTDELQQRLLADQYPREHYQTQAPIGAASAGLAASIALGRLLRMAPHADIASIRFEIRDQGEGAYAGPGPYVIASAAEPDECPSCHTIAGQHPHTEYCRRTAELQHHDHVAGISEHLAAAPPDVQVALGPVEDLVGQLRASVAAAKERRMASGQTSQPATRTSQPPTQIRGEAGPRPTTQWLHMPGQSTAHRILGGDWHDHTVCSLAACQHTPRCATDQDWCIANHPRPESEPTPLATPTPCPDCGVDLAATGDGCTNPRHRA